MVDFGMGRLDAVLRFARAQPRWFVYAISDLEGRPVYVGSTAHPERRCRQHLEGKPTWQLPLRAWVRANEHRFEILDTFPTRRMMLDAEEQYILYLRPQFNSIYSSMPRHLRSLYSHNESHCNTPKSDRFLQV